MLTMATLRAANLARLPLFKNSRGEPAHTAADGSDWSMLEWAGAMCGEVGELADAVDALRGKLANITSQRIDAAIGELADVICYADILAMRFGLELPDVTWHPADYSLASLVLQLTDHAGAIANDAKKVRRGDVDPNDTTMRGRVASHFREMLAVCLGIGVVFGIEPLVAVRIKFNEVSDRIGVPIKITADGEVTS